MGRTAAPSSDLSAGIVTGRAGHITDKRALMHPRHVITFYLAHSYGRRRRRRARTRLSQYNCSACAP